MPWPGAFTPFAGAGACSLRRVAPSQGVTSGVVFFCTVGGGFAPSVPAPLPVPAGSPQPPRRAGKPRGKSSGDGLARSRASPRCRNPSVGPQGSRTEGKGRVGGGVNLAPGSSVPADAREPSTAMATGRESAWTSRGTPEKLARGCKPPALVLFFARKLPGWNLT